LGEVADALGVPPYRLTRLFSAHFGETPREHMLRLRLEHVRENLSETDLPLTEIAYTFGFSSQSHMTTAFKSRFGTSPARYRALARSR
jgi:AraC family transcriptional regulator